MGSESPSSLSLRLSFAGQRFAIFLNLRGAQGRDRTTDTAIFSRMLYQLSYLGILGEGAKASERAVYREVGRACPPAFAVGFGGAGPIPKLLENIRYSASSASVGRPGMT